MPKKEFKCPECTLTTEVVVIDDQELDTPMCGAHNPPVEMKRNYAISGVMFKGKGFYKTDK